MRGDVYVLGPRGDMLAAVPVNFAAVSTAEALHELASLVATALRGKLPRTAEEEALADFHRLIDRAGTHLRRGATDAALLVLASADSLLQSSTPLRMQAPELTAVLAEKRGMALAYNNDWEGAFQAFQAGAITAERHSHQNRTLHYHAGNLYYLAWVADPESSSTNLT
jgi:hypothetical protein